MKGTLTRTSGVKVPFMRASVGHCRVAMISGR
jgi:hypothetical protein